MHGQVKISCYQGANVVFPCEHVSDTNITIIYIYKIINRFIDGLVNREIN